MNEIDINPDILVMDEWLIGPDEKSRRWLVEFLLAFKAAGKTMVISTHNDQMAKAVADRIVYMGQE